MAFVFYVLGDRVVTDPSFVRQRPFRKKGDRGESFKAPVASSGNSSTLSLNIIISVLLLVVAYFAYAFFAHDMFEPSPLSSKVRSESGKPIQLDVLNGCGVSGAASKVTSFLRHRGFDVVDIRNYKRFDLLETLVIDRVGNLATARQVAQTLGVKRENIIQEINPDYFVDVSVVIGKDYSSLPLTQ